LQDIATAEKVTDRFVSRMMRLAYLAPDVLEKLLIHRIPPALSLNDLIAVAELPWTEQMGAVFGAVGPRTDSFRARRHPAACASSSVQNQRSPLLSEILVLS
jgi:hypothetical protein